METKIRQRSGTVDTITQDVDGNLSIKSEANVDRDLRINERLRNEASQIKVPESSPYGFKLARIPQIIVQMWKDEGFDLLSPERSKMTPEEHEAELLRRLSGDWAKLNVSKYKKMI